VISSFYTLTKISNKVTTATILMIEIAEHSTLGSFKKDLKLPMSMMQAQINAITTKTVLIKYSTSSAVVPDPLLNATT
jgi:hypothetical protein